MHSEIRVGGVKDLLGLVWTCRKVQLSSAQTVNLQNHQLYMYCCFKPQNVGVICYTAKPNQYTRIEKTRDKSQRGPKISNYLLLPRSLDLPGFLSSLSLILKQHI